MIIYDLCCDNQHRFEGWFQSAEDFDSQLERHLITCPQCDSGSVRRIPSAVAISRPREAAEMPAAQNSAIAAAMPVGVQALELYRQLASAMISITEDVGHEFAAEARRIHYQEAPERPIRGHTTDEEYEALRDEGIEIIRLPAIKKEDLS